MQFLSASMGRGSLSGGLPVSHELHRMNSGDHLGAVVKGAFQLMLFAVATSWRLIGYVA